MRLRTKLVLPILTGCLAIGNLAAWPLSAQQPPAGSKPAQAVQLPADIDPADPALPVWMRPAVAPKPAGTAPQPSNPADVSKDRGGFKIRKEVDEVTLHATVVDQKQRLVSSLRSGDFEVFEDDQLQQITSFAHEDIPVSLGILVDNSGSMREKRAAVTKAVLNLVKASNPQDEVFIVNFNDEPFLDQDFTNDVNLMREALDRVDSRGGTALYDAVIASEYQLAKGAKREKKILLVVTDGEDNQSEKSLEQAIRAVQNDNGPLIYAIGILGKDGHERRAKRALEELTRETGGVAFFPRNLTEVDQISQEVAHDIRNQYTIAYKPINPQTKGGYRRIKVTVRAQGFRELQVRTRSGYFAGQQKSN